MTITRNTESIELPIQDISSSASIAQLVEGGVSRYISESDTNRAHALEILDASKKSTFSNFLSQEIKQAIIRQRNRYTKKDPRSSVSEKEIEEYLEDVGMMRRIILDETMSRRSLENEVFALIQSRFKSYALNGHEKTIQQTIRGLDDAQLRKSFRDKNFIKTEILGPSGIISPEDRKVDDILSELHLPSAVKNDATVMIMLERFLDTGEMPFVDVHSLIMIHGTSLSIQEKKHILAYFCPHVSLNQLEVLGIISDTEKKEIAMKELEKVLQSTGNLVSPMTLDRFLSTNPDIRSEVENWAEGSVSTIRLSIHDLSDKHIEELLSKDASEMLAASIDGPAHSRTIPKITSFQELKLTLKKYISSNGECLIENIDTLQEGSYIESNRATGKAAYWKIVSSQVQEEGSSNMGLQLQQFDEYGRGGSVVFSEYNTFFDALKQEQSTSHGVRVTNEPPVHIEKSESEYPFRDASSFIDWLGQIDAENRLLGFDTGTAFSLVIDSETKVYTVNQFDPHSGTFILHDQYGRIAHPGMPNITFQQFHDLLSRQGDYFEFNRLGKFNGVDALTESLGIPGIFSDGGVIKMEVEDGKGKRKQSVWGFQNEEGLYVEVEFHGDKVVLFEYAKVSPIDLEKEDRKNKKKKIRRTEHYPQTLGWLYHYLKSNKFTKALAANPTKEVIQDMEHDDAYHKYHAHRPSILGRFSGLKTFGDFKKAVEMGGHMFTHMLEEQQQVHSAEMLYKFFKKTGGADSALAMHALQEFSGAVGKLIDDKMSYLKRIGAGARRKEIRHILSVRPQKPYLLLAAMIVTVEGAGHLYPDSHLQDIQGNRYLWFEALCASLGYDYKTELRKAQEKEGALNAETFGHLNETTLITRFLKTNSENDPYIQAIGAGAKFWKAVAEGRHSQIEKGKKEAGEYLGGMDRAEYAITKLKSNEPEIFVGAFEQAYGKDPSAKVLGIAFVYTLAGFPTTAHPDVSNQMKNYLDAKGVAFHGIPFSRNETNAQLYHDIVSLVVEKSGNSSMQSAWKTVQSETRKGKYVDQADKAMALWDFWKAYHKDIHNILQLADPKLYILREDPNTSDVDRARIKDYITKMGGIFDEGRLNDNKPDEIIMKQGGYRLNGGSMIPDMDKDGTKSVNRILHYIDTNSHNGTMPNPIQNTHLWKGQIIAYLHSMRTNREFLNHPEYQKSQFIKIHDEILSFLREKFTKNHHEEMLKQSYMADLANLGFDISQQNLFQDVSQIGGATRIDFGAEAAYERFRNHHSAHSVLSSTARGAEAVLGGS